MRALYNENDLNNTFGDNMYILWKHLNDARSQRKIFSNFKHIHDGDDLLKVLNDLVHNLLYYKCE
jgi:hypothetical protein